MELNPNLLIILGVAVIILGLSKGGFAGIGMVSTPMVAAVMDPIAAAGLILPIMLVQDFVAVLLYRNHYDKTILLRLLPGGALGVIIAFVFASNVPAWTIKATLGFIALIFSLWQGLVEIRGNTKLLINPKFDKMTGLLAGVASGFSSAVAHAGTPPFQIYAMSKNISKEVYVGTSVMFFAALNLMKLPSYFALGLFNAQALKTSLYFIPLAITSSWLGAYLVKYIAPDHFRKLITIILFFIALLLIFQAWEIVTFQHLE